MKIFTLLIVGASFLASLAELMASPIISEFMASNDAGLADEDGDFSDWIEVHNPDATAVNLDGYFLCDDTADLRGWVFAAVTIEPGAFLVDGSYKHLRAQETKAHIVCRLMLEEKKQT